MALTEVNSLGIKDLEVKTGDIAADAVTSAKIADDQIDSEHYVNASIDHAHLANDCVDGDNLADNACDSEHYTDGSIDHVHLAGDCVDGDNLADNACDSEHYTDGSIDHAHLADDCVDGDNIADNSVGLAAMAGGTDGVIITYDASGNPVHVGPGSDGQVLTSTGAGSPPAFEDAAGGVDGVTTGSGNVTITDGNLIVADGHGIDFSATGDTSVTGTTSGAELLDDYEEGQWTPAIKVGGAGNVSISGSQDKGRYVKIGNFVTIWGYFQLSSKGSDNGDGHVAIDGVPYNSDQYGQPDRAAYSCGAQQWGNWSNTKCAGVTFGNNATRCYPQGGDGTSHAYFTYGTNLNNDSWMGFEISYKTG